MIHLFNGKFALFQKKKKKMYVVEFFSSELESLLY